MHTRSTFQCLQTTFEHRRAHIGIMICLIIHIYWNYSIEIIHRYRTTSKIRRVDCQSFGIIIFGSSYVSRIQEPTFSIDLNHRSMTNRPQ